MDAVNGSLATCFFDLLAGGRQLAGHHQQTWPCNTAQIVPKSPCWPWNFAQIVPSPLAGPTAWPKLSKSPCWPCSLAQMVPKSPCRPLRLGPNGDQIACATYRTCKSSIVQDPPPAGISLQVHRCFSSRAPSCRRRAINAVPNCAQDCNTQRMANNRIFALASDQ